MLSSLEFSTLALFSSCALLASIGIVHVLGYIETNTGNLALAGLNAGLIVALISVTALTAFEALHWATAVVISVLALAGAPSFVRGLPEVLKQGPTGLVVFAFMAASGLCVSSIALSS